MRRGFTLTELTIVMGILVLLMLMVLAAFNPKLQIDKGNDARRKSDLSRIKIAFEEYVNDVGCYPTAAVINSLTCGGNGFAQWGINAWPCDPVTKLPYYIYVGPNAGCPSWFKILTYLNNRSDPQIPAGWYSLSNGSFSFGDGTVNRDQVNFGVSSPNVTWYDRVLSPECAPTLLQCYKLNSDGSWSSLGSGVFYDAYTTQNAECLVTCCNNGSLCQ